MSATVVANWYGGSASEPAGSSAEGGAKLNREDTLSGSTGTIPVPTSSTPGTQFSWPKLFALAVTATDTTSISNRKAYLSSAAPTGIGLFFKASASYVQPSSGNMPAASGSAGATPSTYTALSTTPQTWDSGSDSAGATGRNGDFIMVVLGVDQNYSGGAGASVALPSLNLQYDEGP